MTVQAGSPHPLDRRHPIEHAAARIEDHLKDVREVPTWSMTPAQTRETLCLLTRLEAQVVELQTRVAAHAESVEIEQDNGAASIAAWWAHETRMTRLGSHRRTRLAQALDSQLHEPVRLALADGVLLLDQAEAIIAALTALPADLDPDLLGEAQAMLVREAAVHDAKALRVMGKKLLEVIAPEIGEAHEAKLLDKEEREAEQAAVFRMSDDGHGRSHGRFTLPTWVADQLRKHLNAIAAPGHRAVVDGHAPQAGRPSAHKLGLAFIEYITGYSAGRLPTTGGVNASVVVLMDYQTLLGGLKAAQLDTGTRISPGLARRLACQAGIIPAVLGGRSQVLDLGRKSRFFGQAQRVALAIEQGGCTAEGCDWPPGMCHAHHDERWSDGGTTDLTNGRLLCPRHHARAHDPTYRMTVLPTNKVQFHRRT